ncbi:MAG: methyltransferase domain-containing protein [Candidatus Omnitrophota bacterium]
MKNQVELYNERLKLFKEYGYDIPKSRKFILDRKAQKIAKLKLKSFKLDKSVPFRIMNAEKLQYRNDSFDHVISVNFIHHAKNPAKCLKVKVYRDVCQTVIVAKRGAVK